MGVVSWIVLGFVVGLLAKGLVPGKDPGGLIVTVLIGVAGAFLGGWIGSLLGLGTFQGFDLMSLALAVLGAVMLLVAYRVVKSM